MVRAEERKAEILDGLIGRVDDRLEPPLRGLAEQFVRLFYRDVAPGDLVLRDPLDLYGAALSFLRFGESRGGGGLRLRVFNPTFEQDGWQSTHTIVEIVNDDMPFLVDSVGMELTRRGLGIHLIIHPVLGVRRDGARLIGLGAADAMPVRESFMHVEIDRVSEPTALPAIAADLERVLGDVRRAVEDWPQTRTRIDAALADLEPAAAVLPPERLAETVEFIRWLADDHFTFLGFSSYLLERDEAGTQLRREKGSGLGLLRGYDAGELSRSFQSLAAEIRERATLPEPVVTVTKADTKSTVHRATYLDFIGVKRFAADGSVKGEHRFLGLFTSAAYYLSPRQIPLLRQKVERIVRRSDLPQGGHAYKALQNILETYPRDELFQAPEDELFGIVTDILYLQDRQRLRLFLRQDRFARFVSCLVYVPRDRYNTAVRERLQRLLQVALGSEESEYQAQIAESVHARLLFTVRTPNGIPADLDRDLLERQLVEATQSWSDRLRSALLEARGEALGNRLFARFNGGFPASYQEDVEPRRAVADLAEMDRLHRAADDVLSLTLYRGLEDAERHLRLRLIRRDAPVLLSDALPILENMGLRVLAEEPHALRTKDGRLFSIHDFSLEPVVAESVDVDRVRAEFAATFTAVWRQEAENDGFNRLVLAAGLGARDVVTLRAYCRYLLQAGSTFSQSYIETTLVRNAPLAKALADLFAARFDPGEAAGREARVERLEATIAKGLDEVLSLDQDRILRRYLAVIRATLRTNAFQRDAEGAPHPYLSLKFASAMVPDLPLPRPEVEVFVYGPRVEAIHLRGGKVARGGIRWSDRPEDFRTEVLGLMKAQMVKNSVIVPVGAKGGFVLKRPPAGGDRQAVQEEAVRCYRTFLAGLLDITDNRTKDGIVPPRDVVRYDDDDPYLVVAADKGTATFSDIANEVSRTYGFWLDDAFASGGSAGYDHKAMGITAKGAWRSVERHFRELGLDPAHDPFTVAGVGDMSGDVFGNGMLLSDRIRLIAAFDHRHIFLDPDPDPAASFAERRRLFALPRSSWADYDAGRLSAGGMIVPRTVKSVQLTDEVRRRLEVDADRLSPNELLSAVLRAPVDLFWNGGIGTFVKAASESHADAQDRGSDPIRVDADELRCRVVGEGGNLGFTQRARIAFAAKGGRINTDFVDNSAGVDCSDHEVNIKILLSGIVAEGDLTLKQRNNLLAEMTDEVGALVLRDNVLQNLALSMSVAAGTQLLDAQARFMRKLEAAGRLNRAVEVLPSDAELRERRRAGRGLTRPEIAVLLAYAKMTLYADLLTTDLPERPYLAGDIAKYFPRPLRRRFNEAIEGHRLRREIIATWIANSVVNRGLEVFVSELEDETGAGLADVTLAYVVARDAFQLLPLWSEIEAMPHTVPAQMQLDCLLLARDVLIRGSRWFLAHGRRPLRLREGIERYAPGVAAIRGDLGRLLAPMEAQGMADAAARYVDAGIAAALAGKLAALPYLRAACDVVAVSESAHEAGSTDRLRAAARTYFALDAALELPGLRARLHDAPQRGSWDRLALTQLDDQLAEALRALTKVAIAAGCTGDDVAAAGGAVDAWLAQEARGLDRYRSVVGEIMAQDEVDLAALSVAVRQVGALLPRG